MDRKTYRAIEKKLGYRFRRRSRLDAALTHPSFRHETKDVEEDNQRLEFLGDAALGLVAAADLYRTHRDEDEGGLTDLRSRLVSRDALARLGRELDLGPHLRLGRGEELSGGRERDSTLGDAVEAVIGAVYLDGGIKGVEKVYRKQWADLRETDTPTPLENPKGRLQELCQQRWKENPAYRITQEQGPSHNRIYTATVSIRRQHYGTGQGPNKRAAESNAAEAALKKLDASA